MELLLVYVIVAIVGQVLSYGVGTVAQMFVPTLGLPIFLAMFMGMFFVAWPIAIRLTERWART